MVRRYRQDVTINPADARQFASTLLAWHVTNARDFPWRWTRDPYHILVAELLLQRTRARQAVPVYEEFIKRYPTPHSQPTLSALRSLLRSLGLPDRAERIYVILRRLQQEHNGRVPDDPVGLQSLLGKGYRYVRDAVLAYAFDKPVAPVDRTTARVVSRVFLGCNPAPGRPHTNPTIVSLSQGLVPPENPRGYNLALLDFAALVCTPKPKCTVCPVRQQCRYVMISRERAVTSI